MIENNDIARYAVDEALNQIFAAQGITAAIQDEIEKAEVRLRTEIIHDAKTAQESLREAEALARELQGVAKKLASLTALAKKYNRNYTKGD